MEIIIRTVSLIGSSLSNTQATIHERTYHEEWLRHPSIQFDVVSHFILYMRDMVTLSANSLNACCYCKAQMHEICETTTYYHD
jgi:hypothetical protein